jgi:hypothetical protein
MPVKDLWRQSRFPIMGKLAASLALFTTSALAASDDTAIQNTFVKPWIDALRSKDKARVERLLHPAVRACVNPGTREFFDFALEQEVHSDVSGPSRVTKLEPMRQAAPTFLPAEDVQYPVQPTYEVDVEFEQNNYVFTRFLAPSNGSWFEVFPCPNEKGIAYLRELQKQGVEREKKAARLLLELKEPLRGELRDLLRRQQKFDAIKKYQAAASVDLTTSVMVINALQKSMQ